MSPAKRFLLPHHTHGARAHALSHLALAVYSLFVLTSLITFQVFAKQAGVVLAYATDIHVHEIIELTNEERSAQGLNTVTFNEPLSRAAQAKAEDMFADDYWAHIAPDGTTPWFFIEESGYSFYTAGENLARDFNDSPSVVKAWMNSPSHRDNVLGSAYRDIGVAVVNGELAGNETTLVVQMFGAQRGAPVAAAPEPIPAVEVTPEAVATTGPSLESATGTTPVGTPATALQPSTEGSSLFNIHNVTRRGVLAFAGFLLALFILDLLFVWRQGIVRVSSNTAAHIGMLSFLLVVVWWSQGGLVL